MTLLKRRQNPPHFDDYKQYKPYLREDFSYACVYCAVHENELGGPRIFGVEHFRPKNNPAQPEFRALVTVYYNLMYACSVCNSFKREDWPSDDPINEGKGYIDPCEHDYDDHFVQTSDFQVKGLSPVADYMIERLHLNRRQLQKLREIRKREEELHHKFMKLYQEVLSAIEVSLKDETLPDHARITLQMSREIFLIEQQSRQELWGSRWQPLFDLNDYR
jgi:hypothetical protein